MQHLRCTPSQDGAKKSNDKKDRGDSTFFRLKLKG